MVGNEVSYETLGTLTGGKQNEFLDAFSGTGKLKVVTELFRLSTFEPPQSSMHTYATHIITHEIITWILI